MSEMVAEKNLARYKVGHLSEDDTPFCLAQVRAYETEDPTRRQKVDDLLEGRVENQTKTQATWVCNLGGCTLKVVESTEKGREVSGVCKASSYCLKTAYEAIGQTSSVEEGRKLCQEIIGTLEGHADKYSAGNFCPRLQCGLSAGVSIDGNPGTAGECVSEANAGQLQIKFGEQR